ncbi:MAG: hypothetical protein RLZZ522_1836 [Verrucomicrobiota bacterium]
MIAHAHEGTMTSGFPRLIGFSWASADPFRRSNETRRLKPALHSLT